MAFDPTLLYAAAQGAFQGASGAASYVFLGFASSRYSPDGAQTDPTPFDPVAAAKTVLTGAVMGAGAGYFGLPSPQDFQSYAAQSGLLGFITFAIDKTAKTVVRHLRAAIAKAAKAQAPAK